MEEEQIKYLKGTTTVGLACNDGVVLATDSRATAGYEIASKTAQKLYKITNSIGVTVAGSVGDTQQLVRSLRAETKYYLRREGQPIRVRSAAKIAANMFSNSRMFPYLAILVMGGFDDKGSNLYLLNMDGSLIEESRLATGSGSPVAYGVIETEYTEDMNVDEAVPVAVKALTSAIERDIGTGSDVKVAKITKEGYKGLTSEEIEKISG